METIQNAKHALQIANYFADAHSTTSICEGVLLVKDNQIIAYGASKESMDGDFIHAIVNAVASSRCNTQGCIAYFTHFIDWIDAEVCLMAGVSMVITGDYFVEGVEEYLTLNGVGCGVCQ